ncbi:MAG: hypothetical protein Q8N21_01715 [bacterium]|nr:hypothetical protein [bacterium]
MIKGDCKLCGGYKDLCKAHIIARPFFKFLYPDHVANGTLIALSQFQNKYRKIKVPAAGMYDSGILCAECDNVFGKYDKYAAEILLKAEFDETPEKEGYVLNTYDYKKLKLFFLSLVFRGSVSKHKAFERILVGEEHEQKIRDLLLAEKPGTEDEYSVFLAKFDDSIRIPFATKNIPNPRKIRLEGINFCIFYFSNGMIAYIKIDKRKLGMPYSGVMLKQGHPCFIIKIEYETSAEFKLLMESAKIFFQEKNN